MFAGNWHVSTSGYAVERPSAERGQAGIAGPWAVYRTGAGIPRRNRSRQILGKQISAASLSRWIGKGHSGAHGRQPALHGECGGLFNRLWGASGTGGAVGTARGVNGSRAGSTGDPAPIDRETNGATGNRGAVYAGSRQCGGDGVCGCDGGGGVTDGDSRR